MIRIPRLSANFGKRLGASFAMACALGAAGCEEKVATPVAGPAISGDTARPQMIPVSCAPTNDPTILQQHLPRVADNLRLLARLSDTGAPVYSSVAASPQTMICVQNREGQGGSYMTGKIEVGERHDMLILAHEYFHAHQDLRGANGHQHTRILTARDLGFTELLAEATAAAYEMVVEADAAYQGTIYERSTFFSASRNTPIRDLFSAVYIRSATAYPQDNARAHTWALQEAGRAVVLYLMSGEDSDWRESYSTQALFNANKRLFAPNDCQPGYSRQRDGILFSQGYVSDEINLTPPVYLGDNADRYIQRDIANFLRAPDGERGCTTTPPTRIAARR